MTDDTKLLPCPFCGAAAKSTDEMFGSVIHCDHLHTCPLDGHEQLAAAIREWNTRAAPAEDVREVGDVRLTQTVSVAGSGSSTAKKSTIHGIRAR